MGPNQHAPVSPGGDSIISSLGETELKVVYPADCQMKCKLLEIWPYLASQRN